ncbi:hypothetical protein SGRIM128S_03964 [Streptomyces griseomycini]
MLVIEDRVGLAGSVKQLHWRGVRSGWLPGASTTPITPSQRAPPAFRTLRSDIGPSPPAEAPVRDDRLREVTSSAPPTNVVALRGVMPRGPNTLLSCRYPVSCAASDPLVFLAQRHDRRGPARAGRGAGVCDGSAADRPDQDVGRRAGVAAPRHAGDPRGRSGDRPPAAQAPPPPPAPGPGRPGPVPPVLRRPRAAPLAPHRHPGIRPHLVGRQDHAVGRPVRAGTLRGLAGLGRGRLPRGTAGPDRNMALLPGRGNRAVPGDTGVTWTADVV